MKISLLALLLAILALPAVTRSADISGIITFTGTPPAEKEITPIMDDPNCKVSYTKAPMTTFYVVGAKGELADVVVSLKGITGKSTGASAPPIYMDQKGCIYSPPVQAVQTGQKVIVKNTDTCVHNVRTSPAVDGNKKSNDVQMPNGPDLTYIFAKPEPFLKFQCDMHPWMFAWVTVFDSPYFSVSDTTGKFTIKNVPAGKYTVEAVHRKLGAQTLEVEVKDSDALANFTFAAK